MKNSLSDSAQQLLDIAKLAGAQSADVLIVDGTSVSIDVREGELKTFIGLSFVLGSLYICKCISLDIKHFKSEKSQS